MYNAIWIEQQGDAQQASVKPLSSDNLPEGDVLIKVDYSTINYKDALAITGASPIIRAFPMTPGIDLAGTVEESSSEHWHAGERVVLNGWGVGERHSGGLAQYARLKGSQLIALPDAFDTRDAMAIGTAGYTAALCVDALVNHGLTPDDGTVLVTGATGGVGSFAVALLAKAGFRVAASTGKSDSVDYLTRLGATEIIDRSELSELGKPLQKERWAGAVDAVGGNTLANVCAQTCYRGAVAACGLAESPKLPLTVMPFILRGVALLGVDSVMAPIAPRLAAWQRLATDLDKRLLDDDLVTEVSLSEAIDAAPDVLAGKIRGRLLVDVNRV